MPYNPNIHHRRSIRLKGYDYAQAGLYFITICCHKRVRHFGNVVNGEMMLNEFGMVAHNEWMQTPAIRNNVELLEFVIMPNHIHGIIRLLGRGECDSPGNGNELCSSNLGECNLPLRGTSQTIGAIVRGYKSSVTKQLNSMDIGCTVWQRNYYEHIIRNEQSYQQIAHYIINNPMNWKDDKFYV